MADNFFENLFAGLKSGYLEGGGATPGNVFTGPTPAEEIPQAPAGFAGGAGDFVGSLFGHVSDLALHTIPDVIKNPESFLNDRGELSLTRFAIPEFRREAMREGKERDEIRKAALSASIINQGADLLNVFHDKLTTEQARQAGAGLFAPGDPRVAAAQAAAAADSAAYQQAGSDAGLLPSVAAIADANSAQAAGQSQFADRLAREQNEQQGRITRQNQGNQYTLSDRLARTKHGYRMGEINRSGEVQAGNAQYDATLGAWRDRYKSVLNDWEKGQDKNRDRGTPGSNAAMEEALRDHPLMQPGGSLAADYAAYAALPPGSEQKGEYGKKLFEEAITRSRPSKANTTFEQKKQDAASAEQFLAVVAPDLKDGILKKRALSARGPQAIKLAERVITQSDFAQDDGKLAALENYTQTPSFQNASPQVRDKVTAALASGSSDVAGSTFNQLPTTQPKGASTADVDFINAVLKDPAIQAGIPDKVRALAKRAAEVGGAPAQRSAKDLADALTGASEGDRVRLAASSQGQALLRANTAGALAIAGFDDLNEFRTRADLFQAGGGVYAAAEDAVSRVFGSKPSEYTRAKKVLDQKAGTVKAAYMMSISGATIPVEEVERLSKNLGDVDKDSHQTFFAKNDVVLAGLRRDQEYREAAMRALLAGDFEGYMKLDGDRAASITQTADTLESINGLTPGQAAARSMSDAELGIQ